MTESINRRS